MGRIKKSFEDKKTPLTFSISEIDKSDLNKICKSARVKRSDWLKILIRVHVHAGHKRQLSKFIETLNKEIESMEKVRDFMVKALLQKKELEDYSKKKFDSMLK